MDPERMMRAQMSRRGFVALTGGLSLSAFLAGCGGGGSGGSSSSSAGVFDAATEAAGPVEIFEWAGYEVKEMWADYLAGPYAKESPLKFTFLNNDQQALAKVAAGYNPDIIHPCVAYTKDWQAADLIQPWDVSLLPDYEGIPEEIRAGGMIGDDVYHVAFDIGFSTLAYRVDKIPIAVEDESWNVLLDPAYKQKISIFSDEVTTIKIGALINAGEPIDPNLLDTDQIQASKETMIKAKPQIRNFWDSSTDAINDFVNGNVWATYAWPDMYYKIKTHPKMKDVEVRYMSPKEGRLAWVCGFVLNKTSERPGRAHAAVAAANTPTVGAWLTDAYQYGAAQQNGVIDLIKNKELITAFSLDDPDAFAPPRAWFEKPLDNRKEYVDAGTEVKAA